MIHYHLNNSANLINTLLELYLVHTNVYRTLGCIHIFSMFICYPEILKPRFMALLVCRQLFFGILQFPNQAQNVGTKGFTESGNQRLHRNSKANSQRHRKDILKFEGNTVLIG